MLKINYWKWNNITHEIKENILSRSDTDISAAMQKASDIIDEVKSDRDKALIRLTLLFDKADISKLPLRASEKEFDDAEKMLSDNVKEAIGYSIENVKKYHIRQIPEKQETIEIRPGITAYEKALPIDSAGLYVPRGRGSFPSMLYMLAVPAAAAGVPRICVTTPPNPDGTIDPACLYAAGLCGVDEVYRVGGAQAIAALAYGTESVKPVAKITGPGSIYVTAAKRVLYGRVDVGLPAGPSDSIILADSSADPYKTALDLLIEAEHGSDSSAILVTDSAELADAAREWIIKLIETVPEPRKTFLIDVFTGYGGIIIAENMADAADIVNRFAPEHLQIAAASPEKISELIRNAGEILLGQTTPFSIANYSTGPNAVLPTGGMARTFSSVSVRDYIKYISVIHADSRGLKDITPYVTALADYEGFYTHALALTKRKQ